METFLIEVILDKDTGNYQATYSDGSFIVLDATNYTDAICEADLITA